MAAHKLVDNVILAANMILQKWTTLGPLQKDAHLPTLAITHFVHCVDV